MSPCYDSTHEGSFLGQARLFVCPVRIQCKALVLDISQGVRRTRKGRNSSKFLFARCVLLNYKFGEKVQKVDIYPSQGTLLSVYQMTI